MSADFTNRRDNPYAPDDLPAEIYRSSFRDSSEAIMITDRDGVIVDVNPAFESIYGYTREEVLGHTPRILRHSSTSPETYRRMWEQILNPASGAWKGEIVNRRKNGDSIPVLLAITPIRDAAGDITHYMGLALDISEQRRLEARIERLRRENGATLRHEMRNLLAGVTGYLELARRHAEPVPPRVDRFLESAENSVISTLKVLNALRELEYFEQGCEPLDRRLLHVEEVLRRAADHLSPLARRTGARIVITNRAARDQVFADPARLELVFVNLLKNALEHVAGIPGEDVDVLISGEEGRLAVAIHNGGETVPPERLATFFERFNTTKKEMGGTGLGTTYAEAITRAHGGDVRVTSRDGEGTTVTVLLSRPS
ncbi:MAG: PAS domain S-box protein [Candidatus Zixiibacteriota bacterium]|nr:MAG: PAS domain S-box protein [candidate division Zixibacteria bacterium]